MSKNVPFENIAPELTPVFEELRSREPIFHVASFGRNAQEFANATAPGYREVGASGRRYSRQFILATAQHSPEHFVNAESSGWHADQFGIRRLADDTFLITYTLDRAGRRTRRATIWQRQDENWKILYHQGTLISAEEDDVLPNC